MSRVHTVAVTIAIAAAVLGHGQVQAASPALYALSRGDPVGALRLEAADGSQRIIVPSVATITVFWASWSPESMQALQKICRSVAEGQMFRWRVLAINVNGFRLPLGDRDSLTALAGAAGCRDSVWFDPELEVLARMGVVTIPTTVITGLGSRITLAERGWSPVVEARVLSVIGPGRGPVAESTADTGLAPCAVELLKARRLHLGGRVLDATRSLGIVERSCPQAAFPLVLHAAWAWEAGDTAMARRAADAALAADSTDPWSWMARGLIHSRAGQFEVAGSYAERALTLDASFAPALRLLAVTALAREDRTAAWAAWLKLGEYNRVDPGYDFIHAALLETAHPDSALICWRQGAQRAAQVPALSGRP